MGRSQLQYRRGRGRGRGEQRPVHTRTLESNAFRFKEDDDENDENELEDVDEPIVKRDLRYNPNVQNLTSSTGGIGYFQSKTEQEWEAELSKQEVVALDFKAMGNLLEALPPSTRFAIDEKYCIDLPHQEKTQPIVMKSIEKDEVDAVVHQEITRPTAFKQQEKEQEKKPSHDAALDDELDALLNM